MTEQIDCTTARKRYGLSERQIDQLVHMPGSPAYRYTERGKWWFPVRELERALERIRIR